MDDRLDLYGLGPKRSSSTMASPFSQSEDWKYQCGTGEALPSAQCMALLETNVELRRIVNLYTLWLGNTSTPGQNRRSSRSKKLLNSLCYPEQLETGRRGKKAEQRFFSWESDAALCVFLTQDSWLHCLKTKKNPCIFMSLSIHAATPLEIQSTGKTACELWCLPVSLQIWHGHQKQTT